MPWAPAPASPKTRDVIIGEQRTTLHPSLSLCSAAPLHSSVPQSLWPPLGLEFYSHPPAALETTEPPRRSPRSAAAALPWGSLGNGLPWMKWQMGAAPRESVHLQCLESNTHPVQRWGVAAVILSFPVEEWRPREAGVSTVTTSGSFFNSMSCPLSPTSGGLQLKLSSVTHV